MSQSNCVYHSPYLRYYASNFQFRKIEFLGKTAGRVTSIFWFLKKSKSRNSNFRTHQNYIFEVNQKRNLTSFKHFTAPKIKTSGTAENLDIFFFGWYEFDSRPQESENKQYERRINIYNTLTKVDFF